MKIMTKKKDDPNDIILRTIKPLLNSKNSSKCLLLHGILTITIRHTRHTSRAESDFH